MHPNEELITRFYKSFQARDAEGMVACYHPEVAFSDPVFQGLAGGEARAMWRMLCERGKDLEIAFGEVRADDSRGSAHWEAHYTFSGSGRRVHNIVDATFEFKDGLIARHTDRFDLWRWSRQALGPSAALFGWLPPMQGAIRKKARSGLSAFIASRGQEATKTAP